MNNPELQELISLFLKINPEPSDQQFHALAEAVGVDKEELESVSYSMLGEAEDLLDDPLEASAPSTSLSYGDDDEEGGTTHGCDDPVIPVAAKSTHSNNDSAISRHDAFIPVAAALGASHRLLTMAGETEAEDVLDNPTLDPDTLPLSDVALNDGDPTNDDLGDQEETMDDGFTAQDTGAGLVNNVSDVLTDDGIPDVSLP